MPDVHFVSLSVMFLFACAHACVYVHVCMCPPQGHLCQKLNGYTCYHVYPNAIIVMTLVMNCVM